MAKLKRRHFLLAGAAAIGGLGAWRFHRATVQDAIVTVLHERLSYLKLDEAGVIAFAREVARRNAISPAKLRATDALGSLYSSLSNRLIDTKLGKRLFLHGEERITTLYLLSSDFFRNGSDVSKTVHYISYYDPTVACGNPFARPPLA